MESVDLIVIGSGPAGYNAALQADELGKRVVVVEQQSAIGGTSVHTGTIPSKALREAALYLSGFRQRAFYGVDYRLDNDVSIADLTRRVGGVIRNEVSQLVEHLRKKEIPVYSGHAAFIDPHRVRITGTEGEREVRADKILIATGSRPAHSPNVPVDGVGIVDTDMLPRLRSVPRSLTIIGGGVIGIEYASMAAALGTKVTVVDTRPRLLEFADDEIVALLVESIGALGVSFRLGVEVEGAEMRGPGDAVTRLVGGEELHSDVILYAVGRQSNTEELNLGAAGLTADKRGRLTVNESYQTSVPHIYAAGDVIGFPSLASVSMDQGRLAASHAFGQTCNLLSPLTPFGIYSVPEISFVGQTEEELAAAGTPYRVVRARYEDAARGQIIGDTTGLLKLIFDPESRRVLGVHILGESAADLVHIGQAVMALCGTLDYFIDNAFNYPTLAQCYKLAALAADDPQ
ncbi:MAG TPA: Si-specific NAD(P)(+) transhydrogenase [Armatimonadota bacterium]|nr:Si-specific NAD(P)(+) transhydrogenase [Armatimonadota bacterium]